MSTPHESLPRPLRGVRVLVTRARRDNAALGSQLVRLGAEVVECPLIAVEPPEDWEPLDSALRELAAYNWVAFTSRNAVEVVFGRLQQQEFSAPFPPALRVAAIGPGTAEALRSRGIDPHLVPETSTAEGLAESMIAQGVADSRVLIPAGDLARPTLADALERSGAHVRQVIAYRIVQPRLEERVLDRLHGGEIDMVVVASPSAVQNLVASLGPRVNSLRRVALVCVGSTTAWAVRDNGFEPAGEAAHPTVAALIDTIVTIAASEEFREQSR